MPRSRSTNSVPVEVIHFVLERAREQAVPSFDLLGAVAIQPFDHDALRAGRPSR